MDKNLSWFLKRLCYCLLLASAYWWHLGTTSMVVFWVVTVYTGLNMAYLMGLVDSKKIRLSYDFLVNSIMDIVPASATVISVAKSNLCLAFSMAFVFMIWYAHSATILIRKDYQ